jgi:hypothetical protein
MRWVTSRSREPLGTKSALPPEANISISQEPVGHAVLDVAHLRTRQPVQRLSTYCRSKCDRRERISHFGKIG